MIERTSFADFPFPATPSTNVVDMNAPIKKECW